LAISARVKREQLTLASISARRIAGLHLHRQVSMQMLAFGAVRGSL
jgi:hypothetical protein